jgi:hypothetical protein
MLVQAMAVVVTAGLVIGGCGGLAVNRPFIDPAPIEDTLKPRELRFRRKVGPPDRYQAKYDIRVRNDLQVDETVTAELVYYCSGKQKGPPPFDRVVIWKQEAERSLLEVRPKANRERRVTRKDSTRNWQPFVTPNTEAEPGRTGLRYIPFDELGRILRRKETPFHFAFYDSLCYLWPILPEKPARPGDRWTCDVPIIVGREFTNNLMSLHANFHFLKLGRIEDRGGAKGSDIAIIDYTYYALLDTGTPLDATKLPPNTPGLLWRRQAVEGQGRAYLDITSGTVIWKSENYTVTVEQKTRSITRKEEDRTRREDATPAERDVEHQQTVNTVKFVARLLAPGETATKRPSRER